VPPLRASVEELTQQVEVLLDRFESRAQAEELTRTLVTLYGEGLSRILAVVRAHSGDEVVERLCDDPFVASLLLVHDLHPLALDVRLQRALDSVLPYIRSHGGNVTVLSVRDGILDLEMSGTCDGCSAAAQTLKRTIERAILQAAPEIVEVRANTSASGAELLPKVLS
jgi:Fe-S cluster biogenesis protein NfuA